MKTIVHWCEDNLAVPYFLWRQSSSAPFFSIFLNFLWRQLYYCYLFCEDNCTSAHEDNCPLVWRQLSTALKTIVTCSFIVKTILLVKTIVPLSQINEKLFQWSYPYVILFVCLIVCTRVHGQIWCLVLANYKLGRVDWAPMKPWGNPNEAPRKPPGGP